MLGYFIKCVDIRAGFPSFYPAHIGFFKITSIRQIHLRDIFALAKFFYALAYFYLK